MPVNKWFDRELMMQIDHSMRRVEKSGAYAIAKDAKHNVRSVTGTLERGIKAVKSNYPNGGWLAVSTAPHSHLVEYGHDIKARGPGKKGRGSKFHGHKSERPDRGSSVGGRVKAYPFMRPAKDKNEPSIMAAFKAIYRADR